MGTSETRSGEPHARRSKMPALDATARVLLGSSQYDSTSNTAAAVVARNAEPAMFQIGMCFVFLGFCCGWLSLKHGLLRYRWKAVGRFLLFLGHLCLCIFAGAANGKGFLFSDYFAWNFLAMLVNFAHLLIILNYEKPIKFHPSLDELWKHMF